MRHSSKNRKIAYIVAAAAALLLALFMLFLLFREPSLRRSAAAEATPEPTEAAATAAPVNTILVAGKEVDPETDSFDLSGRALSSEELGEISVLRNLTTLSLTGCSISDLSFLAGLTDLRTLYLPDNRINDLTPLMGLSELRTVYLDRNPLTDLTPLTQLPKLATLSLQGVAIADYVLEDLRAAMPECRIFTDTVIEYARPVSLGGAAFTEDVELLDLSYREITDISKLSYCLQLRELNLAGNPLGSLQTLAGLPKLTALDLSATGLDDEKLAFLATLGRLTYLDIRGNDALTAEGIETLEAALPNCAIVHDTVYFTVTLGGVALTSDLTEIDLSYRGITGAEGLEKFQALRRLVLTGNALTDLTPLGAVASLEELSFASNRVTSLEFLSNHLALRRLNFSHNAVTDLTPLASCTALEELDASYNDLTTLTPLYGCTALRRADLRGNAAITAEEIRALQLALPGCQIVTDVDLSMPEPTPEPPTGVERIPEYPDPIPLGTPEV